MVASHTLPTGDLAHSPGTCPDWESNQLTFVSQAGTQTTEPHQPGLVLFKYNKKFWCPLSFPLSVIYLLCMELGDLTTQQGIL